MEQTDNGASAVSKIGIDYAVKLAYGVIDKSDFEDKRDMLYSVLCFGCMFDEVFAAEPDSIIKKYNCLTMPEPKKYDLYELFCKLSALPQATVEQKKIWYITFGYVIMCGAPHSYELYEKLKQTLCTQEIFDAVLQSRYSVYIPVTKEELFAQGGSDILNDWYSPYMEYCSEKDEQGVTRETRECKRLIALGEFSDALVRLERLLAAFPDDEQIAITDIAARTSLYGVTDKKEREELLKDTLNLIDEYIDTAKGQYFRYYRGITLLGLMDTVGAKKEFNECLKNDPSFELAAFMIKAMEKYEK